MFEFVYVFVRSTGKMMTGREKHFHTIILHLAVMTSEKNMTSQKIMSRTGNIPKNIYFQHIVINILENKKNWAKHTQCPISEKFEKK